MRSRTIGILVALVVPLVGLVAVPTLAGPAYDVEVRLLPTPTPAAVDELDRDDLHFTSRWNAALQRYVEPVDWTTDPNYTLEVWVSDVGSVNTGVTSAYLDVEWDNDAINDATGMTHGALFGFFPEGTINNPISQVTNFGGSDATFAGQGLEPVFARVGWIDFVLTGDGVVDFDAFVALGEIGVLNRTVGNIQITGATVPEPTSLLLLGFGALVCRRRR